MYMVHGMSAILVLQTIEWDTRNRMAAPPPHPQSAAQNVHLKKKKPIVSDLHICRVYVAHLCIEIELHTHRV